MSAQFKPGDTIVTIQDAPTLLGHALPKGTHGTVIRSGPPIVGPYSVYARFEGDRPGDGRQVRPGDVMVVPTTPAPSLPTQDGDDDGREAAPLDPTLVKAGDTVTLTYGKARIEDEVTDVMTDDDSVMFLLAHNTAPSKTYLRVWSEGWTLTAHQPAPEPEPRERVVDILINYSNSRADDYDTADRIMAVLMPDEPRPLPTWGEIHAAITHPEVVSRDPGTGVHYIDPTPATDRLVALFGGAR
jgi:hypothetical protein